MKKHSWYQTALMSVVLILILSGLGQVVYQFQNLSWKGKERFTVIDIKSLQVTSFDPQTAEGLRMAIPSDLMVSSRGGKGDWKAASVTQLANNHGVTWAAGSLADALMITYTKEQSQMSWLDRLVWWVSSRQVRWQTINLKPEWTQDQLASDGDPYVTLNANQRDRYRLLWYSEIIRAEDVGVRIINTTQVAGLANELADKLTNFGYRVEIVVSEEVEIDQCRLEYAQANKDLISIKYLEHQLGCENSPYLANDAKVVYIRLGREYASSH